MQLFRLATAALLSVMALGCSEMRNSTGTISKRIGEVVHAPGATEVDLGKLTSFGWEYFYAFKPGATREEVCQVINAGRNVCGRIVRIEKAPDDHMFLIFGLNGQLTHIELHAVENGRFDMEFGEHGLPRSKAVFKVRRRPSGGARTSSSWSRSDAQPPIGRAVNRGLRRLSPAAHVERQAAQVTPLFTGTEKFDPVVDLADWQADVSGSGLTHLDELVSFDGLPCLGHLPRCGLAPRSTPAAVGLG